MISEQTPQTVVVDGRTLVNRAWMAQHTGATIKTVTHWYSTATWSDDLRPPAMVKTIDRSMFYDQSEFEAFYTAFQERKKSKVQPADPALWQGSPEDWISINLATDWFHYPKTSVISKYLRANPGYFPAPVGTTKSPHNRTVPAFRRGDLQAFERRRGGDSTGTAGPRVTAEAQHRVAQAAAYLEELGGWRRGVTTDLLERHGGTYGQWRLAVREARARLEEGAHDD